MSQGRKVFPMLIAGWQPTPSSIGPKLDSAMAEPYLFPSHYIPTPPPGEQFLIFLADPEQITLHCLFHPSKIVHTKIYG